jgi:copper chaperone CopZ
MNSRHGSLLGVLLALSAFGCGAEKPAATARTEGATSDPVQTASVAPDASERSVTLEVGGMICQDCANKVQASLASVTGVHQASVHLDDKLAIVVADAGVPDSALTSAVRRAGPGYLGLVRR